MSIAALGWIATGLAVCGVVYSVFASVSLARTLGGARPPPSAPRPVSLLKPLSGASGGLAGALGTFCNLGAAAAVQIVFGVQRSDDPAAEVVRALQDDHSDIDSVLVIDPSEHGANRKVSNLINLAQAAKHEVLVLSDADIRVGSDYLRTVLTALDEPGVGAVSCLYVGDGGAGWWSILGAMAISYHFLPNATLGMRIGLAHPCFGSTIALTRGTLTRIGGFEAFADKLADDYEIGRSVRRLGLTVAIPPMVVTHVCDESSARELIAHEIRWARTVRLIDPAGYAGSLVTHPFPLALIAGALTGFSPLALGLIFTTLVVRIAAKFMIDAATGKRAGPWWLLPVRDVLSFGVFLASFAGRTVTWQGRRFRVGRDGVLTQL